jgi:Mrp family chromosome partitioning ATPase
MISHYRDLFRADNQASASSDTSWALVPSFDRLDNSGLSITAQVPLGRTTRQTTVHSDLAEEAAVRPEPDPLTRNEELKLIQQLFLSPNSPRRRTVLFAEVERQGEGAPICALTAELLAAQAVGSVCVVDLDLGEPSLHHVFQLRVAHGVLDVLLLGKPARDAVRPVGTNLWLLPFGSRTAVPSTVLAPDRLRALLQELRGQFDYVLISAPPFSESARAIFLSQFSDGVVLIVQAHNTRRERALGVKESLTAARVPLLGVVLSNRTFPIPQTLYRRL